MSFNGAYGDYPTFSFYINMQISFVPLCEDLCVLCGKKINPLTLPTLPTGRQAAGRHKGSQRLALRYTKDFFYITLRCV